MSTDLTVMVTGESGAGKELVARALHDYGKRRKGPFVALNMAAIPRELIESELFGHERGAFTGAVQRSAGKFEQASGGTLFLDEIGDMPLALQTRLLRVLEDRLVVPIGGEPQAVNVRIISATHRNLLDRVQDGSFREDLYYRLNGLEIALPALRERSDKSQLLDFLLAEEAGEQNVLLDGPARQALLDFAWPGNVRQLRNVLRTLAALCEDGRIGLEDLPVMIRQSRPGPVLMAVDESSERPLDDAERLALLNTLEQQRWHMTHTAEQLGVSRNTLYRKLRKHGIAR
jgi:transcriptional regulator of acetoin/glycerol metabolism